MEPLLLKSVFVRRRWGGLPLLADFHPDLPGGDIGESWDISCYPGADCLMLTGPRPGEPLSALLRSHGRDILGREWKGYNDFPILNKFLAPLHDLPLQVHPDDAYARRVEGQNGKTECWLVLEARPGASLWLGLRDIEGREDLGRILRRGEITRHARKVPARAGDVFFIPAGLVHGLGAGILAYEVQQNSDVTYRLDDFGLNIDTPEEHAEHLRKGFEAVDLEANLAEPGPSASWGDGEGRADFSPYFGFELKILAPGEAWSIPGSGRCRGLAVLDGAGRLAGPSRTYRTRKGHSWLLPACPGEIAAEGPLRLLLTLFPAS